MGDGIQEVKCSGDSKTKKLKVDEKVKLVINVYCNCLCVNESLHLVPPQLIKRNLGRKTTAVLSKSTS